MSATLPTNALNSGPITFEQMKSVRDSLLKQENEEGYQQYVEKLVSAFASINDAPQKEKIVERLKQMAEKRMDSIAENPHLLEQYATLKAFIQTPFSSYKEATSEALDEIVSIIFPISSSLTALEFAQQELQHAKDTSDAHAIIAAENEVETIRKQLHDEVKDISIVFFGDQDTKQTNVEDENIHHDDQISALDAIPDDYEMKKMDILSRLESFHLNAMEDMPKRVIKKLNNYTKKKHLALLTR